MRHLRLLAFAIMIASLFSGKMCHAQDGWLATYGQGPGFTYAPQGSGYLTPEDTGCQGVGDAFGGGNVTSCGGYTTSTSSIPDEQVPLTTITSVGPASVVLTWVGPDPPPSKAIMYIYSASTATWGNTWAGYPVVSPTDVSVDDGFSDPMQCGVVGLDGDTCTSSTPGPIGGPGGVYQTFDGSSGMITVSFLPKGSISLPYQAPLPAPLNAAPTTAYITENYEVLPDPYPFDMSVTGYDFSKFGEIGVDFGCDFGYGADIGDTINIYKSVSGGPFNLVATQVYAASGNCWYDSNVKPCTQYSYEVEAVSSYDGLESARSVPKPVPLALQMTDPAGDYGYSVAGASAGQTFTLNSAPLGQQFTANMDILGGDGQGYAATYTYAGITDTPPSDDDVITDYGSNMDVTSSSYTFTPQYPGSFNPTITINDASGDTTTVNTAITVPAPSPLAVTTTALPTGYTGTSYSTQLQASGGYGAYTWALNSGDYPYQSPEGLEISPDGVVYGTPTEMAADTTLTLQARVTDAIGDVATASFVNPIQPGCIGDPSDPDPEDDTPDLGFPSIWVNIADVLDYDIFGGQPTWNDNASTIGLPNVTNGAQQSSQRAEPHDATVGGQIATGWQWADGLIPVDASTELLDYMAQGGGGMPPVSRTSPLGWFTRLKTPSIGRMDPNRPKFPIKCRVYLPPGHRVYISGDAAYKSGFADYQNTVDLDQVWANNEVTWQATALQQFRTAQPVRTAGLTDQEILDDPKLAGNVYSRQKRLFWDWVGNDAATNSTDNPGLVSEVFFHNSQFSTESRTFMNGSYILCGNEAYMQPKGWIPGVIHALEKVGYAREPNPTWEAAFRQALAQKNVRLGAGVAIYYLKYTRAGSQILGIAGHVGVAFVVASSVVQIYVAKDKILETVKIVGGMAGGAVAAATFQAYWTTLDSAGPYAWAGNAVGDLAFFGMGYSIGQHVAQHIYTISVTLNNGDLLTNMQG